MRIILLCLVLFVSAPVVINPLYAADATTNDLPGASTIYLPLLPDAAPDNGAPLIVPVAANHNLGAALPGITRLVIGIHDDSRNAPAMLATLSDLAGAANAETLILAPQFLTNADITRTGKNLPKGGAIFARWDDNGAWARGEASITEDGKTSPTKSVSAMRVLDFLIYYASTVELPDLHTIIVVGAGLGGSLAELYAATGHSDTMFGRNKSIDIHYIAADAPHYLYLTPSRYQGSKHGFGNPNAKDCTNYNQWPYGLDVLPPYARQKGAYAIKTGYASRPITTVVGDQGNTSSLYADTSCPAMMQGQDNLARAMVHALYLNNIFGVDVKATHKLIIVPGATHDTSKLLGHPCPMALMFGDGRCEKE